MPEIFRRWVEKSPAAIAVVDGSRLVTYAELNAWSQAIAETLRGAGVVPGARVGLPAVRSTRFVAAVLGILEAGGAYLPLDGDEPPERRALRQADCHFVLEWTTDLPTVRRVGEPPREGSATPSAAYVLYTSGSTGKPKGVVVPHRAIARLVCQTDYLAVAPTDRFAFHSNLSFDASTLELWAPLLNGASLVVTPRETMFSAESLGEHLQRHGITSLWLTTSLFAQLAQISPSLFKDLRHLIFGGEAANVAAVRRVWAAGRPRHLINGYGPTETTTFAVCHEVRGDEGERLPIGRPIANTDAWVLDATGEPAEEGELWIGGPGVALGYLGEPELTARSFVETPRGRLYRTGDRARWLGDGTLDYLGRADRQIKIRGFRIEPGEIEAAIRRFPGVRECAVRARPGVGEASLAAYVAGPGEARALRAFLQTALPPQMVPAAYAFLEALPLTANGKLDEQALPAAVVPQAAADTAQAGTPRQREIADAWQRVLSVERIGLDDNFFDLGGTSLSILRLHGELRPLLAPRLLRIVELFRHPTVRTQAAFFESGTPLKPMTQAAERAARRRESLGRRSVT